MVAWAAPVAAAAEPAPTVLLATYVVTPARLAGLQAAAREAGVPLRVVSAEHDAPSALGEALRGAQLLIIDAPHQSVVQSAAARFGETVAAAGTPYVVVGEYAAVAANQPQAAAPLAAERGTNPAWARRLREYWRFGGTANAALAMAALRQLQGHGPAAAGAAALPPAVALPAAGFYHPRWPRIEGRADALARLPAPQSGNGEQGAGVTAANVATVAIAVNTAVFTGGDTHWLDVLVAALERRGLRAYAFYGPRQQKDLFVQATQRPGPDGPVRTADVVVNAALLFNPTERKAELERLGLPVLQTMPALAMGPDEWARSKDGLALADVAYYYTGSELAGMVDAMLITARDEASGALLPIPEQIDALADKAAALVRLQRAPPAARRVAFMVYNYPLGEANFGASFLNVPKSLHNMLAAMQRAGYATEAPEAEALTPRVQAAMGAFYQPEALPDLLARGLAEAFPLARYEAWFRGLPAGTQRRIEAYWGPPGQAEMVRSLPEGRAFVIPRLQLGSAVVLPQPLRHEVTARTPAELRARRIGHRSAVPLSHDYLATYLWLRTQLQAHAVVHVGTHGTLEWAPGKERGLSAQDDPLLALGDLPNLYPYIMDNLGEGLTAKRRGRAVLVSHATPAFSPAGFRPRVQEMHDLMHDWETVAPGPVKAELEARLLAAFVEHRFHQDLQWTEAQIRADFPGFMERLHPYLDELAQTAQPLGLAAFGEVPDGQRRLLTVLQTLRKPLVDALGEDIDEVFLLDGERLAQSRPARWLQVALRDPQAASVLDLRAEDAARLPPSHVPNRAQEKKLEPAVLLALARRAQVLDDALANNEELSGFLRALDGRHLATNYGGDPVRNPESLPTGRNLYGFDPSRVPTRQAWDAGVAAFEAWMTQHRAAHGGRWPEKIAFTLWAGETMRHQGVLESQALHALGLRPRWDEAGRVVGLDTVPAAQLGRPRLDVLVNVTGSYRDQFPTVMRWLDEGVRQVAALREPGNLVARNTQALARELQAGGMAPARAERWATARVFSNEQGSYGTGLAETAQATDLWRRGQRGGGDAQMTELYLARLGHAYGEGLTGEGDGVSAGAGAGAAGGAGSAYARNLAQVDAALMARSSNTYGMLTSDDPFQYLGGIAQAVRQLTGRDPALYVQNLRDESEVRTDSAATALAKEMQTRYLHPQWIKAQQAEGYSGTLQVLKTAQFLWGWQVTAPQAVRQDHWQSLHDVYVRDQYRLGTREWLEGANRAAFAQTLERMLDAVRLGYWQPDSATRRELVQAYRAALKATGLRERNVAVQRYAAAEAGEVGEAAALAAAAGPAPPRATAAPPDTPLQPPQPAQPAPARPTVRGLRLEPQPETPPAEPARTLIHALAALLGASLIAAAGAWRQGRRGARAPLLTPVPSPSA